MLTFIQKTCQ